MNFVMTLHGELRWLVALVAVIAMVRFATGWARKADYGGFDRVLTAAFTGLLDLNLLIGLTLLFGLGGGFPANRIEHATTMLLAVVAAHTTMIWRSSDDSAKKFRNNLVAVAAALVLVLVGVIRLRGGWTF